MLIVNRARPRFAPTLKLSPSLQITSAVYAPLPSPTVVMIWRIIDMISGSMVFIFDVNSRQSTPSPMSHTLADTFFITGLPFRFTSASDSTPAGRGTAAYSPLGSSSCSTPSCTR